MGADGRHVGRRDFLRTGVAAGAALAGGLAARPGGAQGKGKVRFAYLQLGWAACEDGRPSTPSCRAPRRVW